MSLNRGLNASERVLAVLVTAGILVGVGLGLAMPDHIPDHSDAEAEPEYELLSDQPYKIVLRRESVPVKRKGKVVSFKTSYSGLINIASPEPQEFRVVFDTGSGHVVLPSVQCESETCLKHNRYNMSLSDTATIMNADGFPTEPGKVGDEVTIGFGTGQVTGELIQELVCLGPSSDRTSDAFPPCVMTNAVMANMLSTNPFSLFPFDGILGLGLSGLALQKSFSFFDVLSQSQQIGSPHFGVFLTEGDEGEQSELAIGGYDPERLASPLVWADVAMPEKGYWQIGILAIYVDDFRFDFCDGGDCRGVVDTGTSHFGIPAPHDKEIDRLMTRNAGDLLDCRLVEAPVLKIELIGPEGAFNITLGAENYMRQLPLRADVTMGPNMGVFHPGYNASDNASQAAQAAHFAVKAAIASEANSSLAANSSVEVPSPWAKRWREKIEEGLPVEEIPMEKFCRPRTMPVRMPAPLGPNLFILGEPILHRYYTVFDWRHPRIGFGLSNNRRYKRSLEPKAEGGPGRGTLPEGVDVYL